MGRGGPKHPPLLGTMHAQHMTPSVVTMRALVSYAAAPLPGRPCGWVGCMVVVGARMWFGRIGAMDGHPYEHVHTCRIGGGPARAARSAPMLTPPAISPQLKYSPLAACHDDGLWAWGAATPLPRPGSRPTERPLHLSRRRAPLPARHMHGCTCVPRPTPTAPLARRRCRLPPAPVGPPQGCSPPGERACAMDAIATKYLDECLANAVSAVGINTINQGDYRQVTAGAMSMGGCGTCSGAFLGGGQGRCRGLRQSCRRRCCHGSGDVLL